ncbi:MAG: DNA-binding protein, partial [Clostridia bacterium]|nr:DNA-binding protein [Clostridia bacterium]
MKDDLAFLQLWDLYSPLLTATQREITDLYFNYDLSLGEIAEQKGVSRQSVS